MEPKVLVGWKRNGCKKIVTICESFTIKYILRPIFFILPPSLITTIAVKENLTTEIINFLGHPIGDYLGNSAILIICGAYIYVVIIKAVYAGIEKYAKSDKELNVENLFALIRAIDIVVGDKTKRMSIEAKQTLLEKTVCGETTFNKITRPDQQIALLISGIRSVFSFMDKKSTAFRVGLITIVNNKPFDWYSFDPISTPPRTEATALGVPSSTVSRCIKNRSIIVIENIQKEINRKSKKDRRFMKGNTKKIENGSQLCYPKKLVKVLNMSIVIN